METARGLGELLKTGWRPKRTIILASWDGEEWGLLGSTEWAEKHAAELTRKAAVYINSDGTGKGWLGVAGSHSLQAFVNDVMRDLPDPKRPGKTLFQATRSRAEQAKTEADKARLRAARLPARGARLGIRLHGLSRSPDVASLNVGFGGEGDGGVYHSKYDSFYWYTHFSDGDFVYDAALSRRMAPRSCGWPTPTPAVRVHRHGADAEGYVDEVEKLAKNEGREGRRSRLQAAAGRGREAAEGGRRLRRRASRRAAQPKRSRAARRAEPPALHDRARFQVRRGPAEARVVQAPGLRARLLHRLRRQDAAGIREGIEQKAWDEPQKYIPIVAAAIEKLAAQVDKAAPF